MKKLNGIQLKQILESGANAMSNNIQRIDALNVFPVPDGDTGSNMGATIQSAIEAIKKINDNNIGNISAKFARGMLLGARGNSGVILSQIFKGLSVGFSDKYEATTFDIVEAFKLAKEYGYKSVMKPIEGTILTVISDIAKKLEEQVTPAHSIEELFEIAVNASRQSTDNTPNLLPVLKEVGVTDSGGEGLFLILEGMLLALRGKPVELSKTQVNAEASAFDFFSGEEDFNGEFGYCTEFIVELKSHKNFKQNKFETALEKMSSSIIVVHDDDILKVHLHTLYPGKVLNFAQKFGEFLKIKSENMTLQANESTASLSKTNEEKETDLDKINIGIISCHIGSGIMEDAKELGANFIIEGGQTMNPSAKDFMSAINKINSNNIIILPNNSNIILVAQQVAKTIKNKNILIIPTKTQMQGLTALMHFDRDGSLENNKKEMNDAIEEVKTGQVTMASRNTSIGGVKVREGEYLAIADRKIIKSTLSKVQAAILVSKKLIDDETEIVTIYYGDDATKTDAEEVSSFIETRYDVDVEIKSGKQPIYNFLIAFE